MAYWNDGVEDKRFDQAGGSKIPLTPTEVGSYITTSGGVAGNPPPAGKRRPPYSSKRGRIPPRSAAFARKTS